MPSAALGEGAAICSNGHMIRALLKDEDKTAPRAGATGGVGRPAPSARERRGQETRAQRGGEEVRTKSNDTTLPLDTGTPDDIGNPNS